MSRSASADDGASALVVPGSAPGGPRWRAGHLERPVRDAPAAPDSRSPTGYPWSGPRPRTGRRASTQRPGRAWRTRSSGRSGCAIRRIRRSRTPRFGTSAFGQAHGSTPGRGSASGVRPTLRFLPGSLKPQSCGSQIPRTANPSSRLRPRGLRQDRRGCVRMLLFAATTSRLQAPDARRGSAAGEHLDCWSTPSSPYG